MAKDDEKEVKPHTNRTEHTLTSIDESSSAKP
jgi:hypothetical protein